MKRCTLILAVAGAIGATVAIAQPMPPLRDEGARPSSERIDRTGSLAGSGQTKPPGAAVGDEGGTRPDLEEKSRRIDRKIRTGICSGC